MSKTDQQDKIIHLRQIEDISDDYLLELLPLFHHFVCVLPYINIMKTYDRLLITKTITIARSTHRSNFADIIIGLSLFIGVIALTNVYDD